MVGEYNRNYARKVLNEYIKYVNGCKEEENEPLPFSYALQYIGEVINHTVAAKTMSEAELLTVCAEMLGQSVYFLYSPMCMGVQKTSVDTEFKKGEIAIPFNSFTRGLRKVYNDLLLEALFDVPTFWKAIAISMEKDCIEKFGKRGMELVDLKLTNQQIEVLFDDIRRKLCIERCIEQKDAVEVISKDMTDLDTGEPILDGVYAMLFALDEELTEIKQGIIEKNKKNDMSTMEFFNLVLKELGDLEDRCKVDVETDISEIYANIKLMRPIEKTLIESTNNLLKKYIDTAKEKLKKDDKSIVDEKDVPEKLELALNLKELQENYANAVDDFFTNYMVSHDIESMSYMPALLVFFDIIENIYIKDYAGADIDRYKSVITGTDIIIHTIYAWYRAVTPLKEEDIDTNFTTLDQIWLNTYKEEMLSWVFDNIVDDTVRDKYNYNTWRYDLLNGIVDVQTYIKTSHTYEFQSYFIDKYKGSDMTINIAERFEKSVSILNKMFSHTNTGRTKYNNTYNNNTVNLLTYIKRLPFVYRVVALDEVEESAIDGLTEAIKDGVSSLMKNHPKYNGLRKKEEPKEAEIKTPKEIKEELDKSVIGQEQAKKVISVGIYNHYKRIQAKKTNIKKSNIMMVGSTGCGKTEIARTVAEVLNVPFVITDATSLTEAGYVGEDVENILLKLINACDGDIERAEKGIVYIDEIDKIARSGGVGKDVGGEGVQQSLLKIIEGAKVEIPIRDKRGIKDSLSIDTSNILFICGGAFEGLTMKEKSNKIGLGFTSTTTEEEITDVIDSKAIVKSGLLPELVGRFPIIVKLETLTEKELKRILVEPKNSIIDQYKDLLDLDNIELEFTNQALEYIAKKAYELKTGARSLKTILEKEMTELMFDLPSTKNVRKVKVSLKNNKLSFNKTKIVSEQAQKRI